MDDCGGGYSESIAEICEELQNGLTPLLIVTPNGRDESGANRDCYLFSPAARAPVHTSMFRFLGAQGAGPRGGGGRALRVHRRRGCRQSCGAEPRSQCSSGPPAVSATTGRRLDLGVAAADRGKCTRARNLAVGNGRKNGSGQDRCPEPRGSGRAGVEASRPVRASLHGGGSTGGAVTGRLTPPVTCAPHAQASCWASPSAPAAP